MTDEEKVTLVLKVLRSDLPEAARLVLLDLLYREWGGEDAPSIQARASELGMERKTVMRAERELEAAGCLVIFRAEGRKSVYRVGYPRARRD